MPGDRKLDLRTVETAKAPPANHRAPQVNLDQPPLRAGMSVEVDVNTGHARGLPNFLTALFGHSQRSA